MYIQETTRLNPVYSRNNKIKPCIFKKQQD